MPALKLIGCVLLVACNGTTVLAPDVGGTFPLVSMAGATLPFDHGPMPSRDGVQTGCRYITTEGSLEIDQTANGTFTITWLNRNSCTNQVLATSTMSGTVGQDGNSLHFVVPRPLLLDQEFSGSVTPDQIIVDWADFELVFRR